jgi:hypothetical protein
VEVHVREEAEDERGEGEAGEVGEERGEGAAEEGPERRRGERVEAEEEEDGEGKGEEVAGGRGGADGGGGEADREWDGARRAGRCGREGWRNQFGVERAAARCARSAEGEVGRGWEEAMRHDRDGGEAGGMSEVSRARLRRHGGGVAIVAVGISSLTPCFLTCHWRGPIG